MSATHLAGVDPRVKDQAVHLEIATIIARMSQGSFTDDPATEAFSVLKERMGWTDEYLDDVEDPSHPPLKDMDLLVERLKSIHDAGSEITVVPDFDMDGISAGVLLYAGLCELGFTANISIPDYDRGHDLVPEAFDEALSRFPDTKTVITVDAGVNSHAGVRHAKERLGLEVLVTDHHLQLDPVFHGDVLVDPCRIDETYPHPEICGAFVAQQTLEAYADLHAPDKRWKMKLLRLLSGLGTVGDVMPVLHENRQVIRQSLGVARMLFHARHPQDTATPYDVRESGLLPLLEEQASQQDIHHPAWLAVFRGFAYLLRAMREAGSIKQPTDITEELYGFYIAPAFNAARHQIDRSILSQISSIR